MPIRPEDAAAIPAERDQRRADLLALLASSDVHCPRCRYTLRGSQGVQCPECGWVYDAAALREQLAPPAPVPFPWSMRWTMMGLMVLSAVAQTVDAARSPHAASVAAAVLLAAVALVALVWMGTRRALWRGPRTLLWLVIVHAAWIGGLVLGRV